MQGAFGVTRTHANKLGGVTPSVGASGSDLVPPGDIVEHSGVVRGADIEERNGSAKSVHIKNLKYHCVAELAAPGVYEVEPIR